MFSFQKLNNVKVHDCMSLKYLFSVSIVESLSELERLDVYNCGVDEFVVDDQGEANVAATFVFPRITSLEFNRLPRLKTFYRGVHTSQWQNLKRLTMRGCDEVELFASKIFNFQENYEGQHGSSVEPLFIVEKVTFPSLEEIKISEAVMYHQLQQLNINWLPKLKHIWKKDPQAKLFFEELPMPESLTVNDCDSIEEIFDLQKVNFEESHSRAVMYHQLKKLYISGLPKLKHIWKKDPQKMSSFQKLNNVKVRHCMSLKYLFPVSIAKSLLELKQLCVHHCGVEEIVVGDQGEAKVAATFVFPRITSLELNYLPRLKTFYCGVHTSQWQNLKRLVMCRCDKVELFASEVFNFQETNEGQRGSSVQPLFIVEKHIWKKDPQAKLFFEELPMPESLTVNDCDSIEEIFDLQKVNFEESPSRAVPCRLQELNLEGLPKLKHIWKKDPQAKLSFENLQKVKVSDCQKLLASQLSCFQENNIDISVQPPFFLVEKDSFPILEKLILIGEGARMISQEILPST
ncbi:hypothetical protein QYF36_014812 [Acer negundo]|nr:hypothetical protein QYF36_014812 [Acer negundo]